jgi:hypothetical protein
METLAALGDLQSRMALRQSVETSAKRHRVPLHHWLPNAFACDAHASVGRDAQLSGSAKAPTRDQLSSN